MALVIFFTDTTCMFFHLICHVALEEGTEDDGSSESNIRQHGLWPELQRHLLPEEAQPTGKSCRHSPAQHAPAKTTFIDTDRKAVRGHFQNKTSQQGSIIYCICKKHMKRMWNNSSYMKRNRT